MAYKKATKERTYLRMALVGPGGSGKTYTGLILATELAKLRGGRAVGLCTERGTMRKYSDLFDFDQPSEDMTTFSPANYTKEIKSAEKAGFKACLIDSLSHAWSGIGGALEMADKATARGGNKFTAWREVTPQHNELVDTILTTSMDMICTLRVKTEYVMETNERGKQVPRRVGLQPIQREGMEYEFDVIGDIDLEQNLVITKTRCPALIGAVIKRPGAELARTLFDWVSSGVAPTEKPPTLAPRVEHSDPVFDAEVAIVREIRAASDSASLASLTSKVKSLPEEEQQRVRKVYQERKKELQESF